MVDALVEKGFAYVTPSGDVMYDTVKFPAFGELARRKLDEQRHGERVAVDDEKKNPNDFVLWKANAKSAAKLEQAFLPKDFGAKNFDAAGRPGWHIECSAMSRELLGDTFDIHGGGEDLQFPHHSCEIAQTEALTHAPMCDCWMHVAFITVGGKRMGKSEGNFTTIRDALAKYSPAAIRLWLLKTHYRDAVDFTDEALKTAENEIKYLIHAASKVAVRTGEAGELYTTGPMFVERVPIDHLLEPLLEDLDLKSLLDKLVILAEETNVALSQKDFKGWKEKASPLATVLEFLGFTHGLLPPLDEELAKKIHKENMEIHQRVSERNKFKASKNWVESDRLRKELLEQGVSLEDKPDGTTTWRRK
jgi:cysteinyl-tRNA synthetase